MSTNRIGYSGPAGTSVQTDPIAQSNASTEEFGKMLGNSNETGSNDMKYYLKLQQSMLHEQQVYQALSTIMKARFDSATTAIRNFK